MLQPWHLDNQLALKGARHRLLGMGVVSVVQPAVKDHGHPVLNLNLSEPLCSQAQVLVKERGPCPTASLET
jgi:hypothetical protein